MSFRVQTSQLAFSENHQQVGNSADRILFPKISVCGLNFQIKKSEQINLTSVLAHADMPLKSSETIKESRK